VAFEAWGETPADLFRSAADATLGVMVEKPETVEVVETVPCCLENIALDLLLFDFLGELIFLKDARRLLLRPRHISITEIADGWRLESELGGEPIDPARHQLQVDVKAVTLHRLEVVQTDSDGWRALVVLDI
jgi:SHS2 domain-containing protein